MILLIDNYDSFVYNVYQVAGAFGRPIEVVRNDAVTVEDVERMSPEALILSPGPGRPEDAGVCIPSVKKFAGRIPMLGICLGHQAICAAFGARVGYAKVPMHGKVSTAKRCADSPILAEVPEMFDVARYHSLAVEEATLPQQLVVTSRTDDGEVMSIQHASLPVFGVQFHPESVMTPEGARMLGNFANML